MNECSVGKHVFLWLVYAWQLDAHFQIRILTEQQQKTKLTNYFIFHSANAFHLQRPSQMSQQRVIGLVPIKTVSETVNKTLEATKYILSGTTPEMSRTQPLPDIQRSDNRLMTTMSHN